MPPEVRAKVSSELTKEWSRLRAGACTCYEGLSDDPKVKLVVARSEQLAVDRWQVPSP